MHLTYRYKQTSCEWLLKKTRVTGGHQIKVNIFNYQYVSSPNGRHFEA